MSDWAAFCVLRAAVGRNCHQVFDFESFSATWNLSTDGAFAVERRKTTGSEVYLRIQSAPRSKHTASLLYSQLMLYREIMAVCSEIHTKHINTLCGQNVELLNVKVALRIVTTVRYV